MHHQGKRLFITGIPTAGKSYLAHQLGLKMGAVVVNLDDLRESLAKDERYKKWVNFYLDLDEKFYFSNVPADEQIANLIAQSEAVWPAFLEKINEYATESRPVVFECVNLLPHLVKKHFDFPLIVLTGKSYEEVLERNKENPRWGNTLELQTLEARSFFTIERPFYASEAKKYGYPTFETADEALLKI